MRDLTFIAVNNPQESKRKETITIRCAFCGHIGSFNRFSNDVEVVQHTFAGLRSCPNPRCRGLVTVRYNIHGDLDVHPSPLIPFDTKNIPTGIVRVFQEALKCHSIQCFTAAAIMIRRTLEEICADRSAEGRNLFKRIEDLSTKIVLPQELRDALHELRLLGNDAAHIEASTFSKISEDEILVAVEFTKEILKATYQYADLLERLRNLKKKEEPETEEP